VHNFGRACSFGIKKHVRQAKEIPCVQKGKSLRDELEGTTPKENDNTWKHSGLEEKNKTEGRVVWKDIINDVKL